jgi:hypothetical protein
MGQGGDAQSANLHQSGHVARCPRAKHAIEKNLATIIGNKQGPHSHQA